MSARFSPTTLIRQRPRLVLAIIAGLATFAILPHELHLRHRILIGWNVIQWVYLLRLFALIRGATPERIGKSAAKFDESANIVLGFFSVASLMSLFAIVFELATGKQAENAGERILNIGLPAITLAGVWIMLGTLFAIHYTHEYYIASEGKKPIRFPDEIETPGYWDFLYFSFTIAVASQTADVVVLGTEGRKLVLFQSVLSFLFNMSVLGLTINIAAGLLS